MKLLLVLSIFISDSAFSQEVAVEPEKLNKNSFGLGIGIPYGILGLNVDRNILPNVDASLGIGSTIYDHVGIEGGIKYYLAPPENIFRPRVSCFYGTNNIVYFDINENLNQTYSGMSLGFGSQFFPGSAHFGCDFDVFYLVTTNYRKQIPNAALSLGLRKSF